MSQDGGSILSLKKACAGRGDTMSILHQSRGKNPHVLYLTENMVNPKADDEDDYSYLESYHSQYNSNHDSDYSKVIET